LLAVGQEEKLMMHLRKAAFSHSKAARSASICFGVVIASILATEIQAQPFGIDTRTPNMDIIIDELPDDASGPYELVRVFPRLTFFDAMQLLQAPDSTNRIFIVSRNGYIRHFPKSADPAPGSVQVFLNISSRVTTSIEMGMLAMAFSPDFENDGEFYVH
jgi:hypothetical protein